MMDIEPEVLAVITMDAQPTSAIVEMLYSDEWRIKSKRGQVFKALCNLEDRGAIVSRIIRTDKSCNPSRYWALPGGSFPEEVSA